MNSALLMLELPPLADGEDEQRVEDSVQRGVRAEPAEPEAAEAVLV